MKDLFIYVGAYLIGCIQVSVLLGKSKMKQGKGGMVGYQDLYRIFTPKFLLDILKGAAAITLAHILSPGDMPDWVFAGFLVLMGDEFPAFYKFKGDRGLGTLVGVFGALLFWMLTHHPMIEGVM